MEKEFLCCLHSSVECGSRGYSKGICGLASSSEFATCQYRQKTIVLPAAELEESPDNVAQQTNSAIAELAVDEVMGAQQH